jgi:uncharacterized protein YjbJ (UPF0337 family)
MWRRSIASNHQNYRGRGPIGRRKSRRHAVCASERTAWSLAHIIANERRNLIRRDACVETNHEEIAMNKDQVKGRVKEVKGKAKEIAGVLAGDETLEQKGKLQNAVGKAQAGYGDLKRDLKKAT